MKRGKLLLLAGILTGCLALGLPATGSAEKVETVTKDFTLDPENFQPLALEDDENFLFQITGLDTAQEEGEYAWDIHLENRSSELSMTITSTVRNYVNDYMCLVDMEVDEEELAPGAGIDGKIIWSRSVFAEAGAKEISEIGFGFYAETYDFSSIYDRLYRISFTSPISGATDEEIEMNQMAAENGAVENAVLLENEDCVLKLTRIQDYDTSYWTYYRFENKSDQKLLFYTDNMMLNGVSVDKRIYGTDALAHKWTEERIFMERGEDGCIEETDVKEVKEIAGIVVVKDEAGEELYREPFSYSVADGTVEHPAEMFAPDMPDMEAQKKKAEELEYIVCSTAGIEAEMISEWETTGQMATTAGKYIGQNLELTGTWLDSSLDDSSTPAKQALVLTGEKKWMEEGGWIFAAQSYPENQFLTDEEFLEKTEDLAEGDTVIVKMIDCDISPSVNMLLGTLVDIEKAE